MQRPKRVLCLMDLACAGRSSLAVVLPVLAACGVQALPLPTALFSTHTLGFGQVERQDEAAFGLRALAHLAREEVAVDAVYTGYLNSAAQLELAQAAMAQYPRALRVVDPAMADNGKLYSGMDEALVEGMRALCEQAGLITPNWTESALLTGTDLAEPFVEGQPETRVEALCREGRAVVLTSVPDGDGGFCTMACPGADTGGNVEPALVIPSARVPQSYPGTGDLFCAALVGLLLRAGRGAGLEEAAAKAAAFAEAAVHTTHENGGPVRDGVWFEPLLPMLAQYAREMELGGGEVDANDLLAVYDTDTDGDAEGMYL